MNEPIIERIKNRLAVAVLNKETDVRDFLKVIVGETQRSHQVPTDKSVTNILKKMLEGNKELERYPGTNREKIDAENEILNFFLPKAMSAEEVRQVLVSNQLVEPGQNEGQAIGSAMKKLKSLGREIDSAIVINVVREIRNGN